MGPVKQWVPLESNPEVLNEYASQLGLNIQELAFCDVWGLDDELLDAVPKPVCAVLMLYPITEKSEKAMEDEEKRLAQSGQEVSSRVFYMRQTISNACGTIALLHAVGNNMDKTAVLDDSFFKEFFGRTKGMTPAEIGAYLENPPADGPNIEVAHSAAASLGQTAPPQPGEEVNLHFVTFVTVDGNLYELDGRKKSPVNHGPSTPETLLNDAVRVVKRFIQESNSIEFNLMAFTKPGTWNV